jgi:hypothetical protein
MLKWAVLGFALAASVSHSAAIPRRPDYAAPNHEVYAAWLKTNPSEAVRVERFEAYLQSHDVSGILPTEQLLRSSSEWQRCQHSAFDLAPETEWPHVVKTLGFIRDQVIPAVGPVEVVSGYREPAFNACAGGAGKSAHRDFWALDMIPLDATITRKDLIERICKAHIASGRAYNTGLGFYSGLRFHIDSKSYRRWGADSKGASSPCA